MPEERKESEVDNVENFSIPASKYIPEEGSTPNYRQNIPNFAGEEETVRKTLSWVNSYKGKYESQGQRTQFDKEIDIADEMYRASKTRSSLESEEKESSDKTKSNVRSGTFYSDLRAITASENVVILGNEEQLPVVYEPIPGSSDYREDEGLRIAKYRNMILEYVFDTGRMRDQCSNVLWATNKYANVPCEMTWDYREEERVVRQPVRFIENQDGTRIPKKFSFTKKKFKVADYPKLIVHDNKDCWIDSMIDDMQQQSCIVLRTQKTYAELISMQQSGVIKNMEMVRLEHRYKGESEDNNTKVDRQSNAGESEDAETPTNLFDIYYGWIRVPINDETGKWEPDKQMVHWYEYAFVGKLSGNPVCVKLKKLPYACGNIPFWMMHSHKDDKGAYHLGYSTLVRSNIAQELTAFDQAFDNVKLRIRKPLIADRGSISIRDKTFMPGGQQVLWKTPGAQDPHEMNIQDTTQILIPMLEELEKRRQKIMGVNKPLLGEALGSRTSASEAIGLFEQALKPSLEDAKYKANQLLINVAYWVKEMWDQFSDPERSLFVTYEGEQKEIKPENVWGDLGIRVTAIRQFQDGIIAKKERDAFINSTLPIYIGNKVIDSNGLKEFAKQDLETRGFRNIDQMLSTTGHGDARRMARMENAAILIDGLSLFPKPDDNDAVHMEEHKPTFAAVMLFPDDKKPFPQSINNMKLHMQAHEQRMSQNTTLSQNATQSQPELLENGVPARTPGEMAGDMISAEAGAQENLGATELGGREPLIRGVE